MVCSEMTRRAGEPARVEAVKSGCSSLVSTNLAHGMERELALLACPDVKPRQPLLHVVDPERSPAPSASSTSAERITAAIISWRSVIPSRVSQRVSQSIAGKSANSCCLRH